MTEASDMRAEAADIRRLAVGKIDGCDNPQTIKRYAGVPENLAGQRRSAENALRGAARLDRYAQVMEDREKAS